MASDIDAAILLNNSVTSSTNTSTDDNHNNNSSVNPANSSNSINDVNKNKGNELDYGKMSIEDVFNLAREFVRGNYYVLC